MNVLQRKYLKIKNVDCNTTESTEFFTISTNMLKNEIF